MIKQISIAVFLSVLSLGSFAQTNISTVCSWGVRSQVEKSTAAQLHCESFAGPNGFRSDNPDRAKWIGACMPIVNQAVASCSNTDVPCMKTAIGPLKPQVCALNQQFQTLKK
jgi:hypothetical protein